jgi:uncharacterized lipoprotein YmbA
VIRRGIVQGAAAIGVVVLLAGCVGRGAPTQYFTLGAIAAGTAAPAAARPELGLAVGPIEFPRYLDRPEIVTRDGAHRLVLSNANRWGGSLRSDVLRVLADDLGRLLGTSRVAVFPNEPRFRLDYRVLLDLREFEGVPGESVTLRAGWTVVSGADGKALAVEQAHVVQPVASVSFEDLVAAQRAALGTLSQAIADRLAVLPVPAAGGK